MLNELDKEVRRASSIEELEITESMKTILRKMAEIRVCITDCESIEECHQRLLNDAERFQAIYRKRGRKYFPKFHLSKNNTCLAYLSSNFTMGHTGK